MKEIIELIDTAFLCDLVEDEVLRDLYREKLIKAVNSYALLIWEQSWDERNTQDMNDSSLEVDFKAFEQFVKES